jgi:hypothetical protein
MKKANFNSKEFKLIRAAILEVGFNMDPSDVSIKTGYDCEDFILLFDKIEDICKSLNVFPGD